MGLFDKKTKKSSDAFDQLDEQPQTTTTTPPPAVVAAPAVTPKPEPVPKPLEADHPDYGINKAIELMRMLPDDNIELVVRVVKTTLESTNVKVATIIKDAIRKEGGIERRVEVLKKEIAGLESEIATRRAEIATLEADHKETAMVKDRLMLAESRNAEQRPAEKPAADNPATVHYDPSR